MKKLSMGIVNNTLGAVLLRVCVLMVSGVLTLGHAYAATPYFSDGLEWADINEAINKGPWAFKQGDATISTKYAHSGNKSLRICYARNEHQSFLAFLNPANDAHIGADSIVLGWWELREANYDWSGEKFNRVMGKLGNGNLSIDYPLGWVASGGWGQPGTNDAGAIQMFGNSVYSNGKNHFSHTYKMPRQEWHHFEYELTLNNVGVANGATRLWIDGVQVAQKTNVELRYDSNHTIDQVWIGGWYSGGNKPEPSPACRFVDDITLTFSRTTVAPPNPPIPQ